MPYSALLAVKPFMLVGVSVLVGSHSPNPPLNSDPACIAFRSLSAFRFLGSAQRFGAGVAG